MMHRSLSLLFRMKMGEMFVDYRMLSRDHKKSVTVEEAQVDPSLSHTIAPMHWLEALRSPSKALPRGYYVEQPVYVRPPNASKEKGKSEPNAIRAGPLVCYIVGQTVPVVLNVDFVQEEDWGMKSASDCDLRVGMDAIEQCALFNELRPGGLLSSSSVDELKKDGLVCGLAESPLVPRPWTRMKYMFIDELQRGPPLTEFVGYNPRVGSNWRFSQHTKYFRTGIWRELTRRSDLVEGLHSHSSYQRSPQQSVPEVRFMAPSP